MNVRVDGGEARPFVADCGLGGVHALFDRSRGILVNGHQKIVRTAGEGIVAQDAGDLHGGFGLIGLPAAYSRRIRTTVSTTNIPDPDRLEENPDYRA